MTSREHDRRSNEAHALAGAGPGTGARQPVATFWRWVLAFAVLGLAVRLTHLFAFDHDPIGADGFGYVRAAQLAAQEGQWFANPLTGGPSAGHPPLWTLLLSIVAVLGIDSQVGLQVVASLIGTATIVAVALAGRRVAGTRTGIVAAAIAALYPGLWIYERTMLSETLLLLVTALVVLFVYRFLERPTTWRVVGLGALAGIAALTRSEQILLFVVVVVPVLLGRRERPWPVRLGWVALAGATTVVLVLTWTAYNRPRFDTLVLLSDQSSMVLNLGNCEGAYEGPNTGGYDTTCAIEVAMRKLPEGEAQAAARELAFTNAREHLGRLPVVAVARTGRTFGFWSPLQQIDIEWELYHTGPWLPRAGLLLYWILVPFAIGGAIVCRRRGIRIYPLVGIVGIVLLTTVATLGEARYRAAAEVPIVLLAAVAVAALSERWARAPVARSAPDPSGQPTAAPAA